MRRQTHQPTSFGQVGRCAALTLVLVGLPALTLAQDPANVGESPAIAATASDFRGLIPEPRIVIRTIDFASRLIGDGGENRNGLYPELSNMPTGSGWISAGPGYRRWFFGDRVFANASAAISWRGYKMTQARFELPRLARSRLTVGSQVRWQDLTQITYYGSGAASLEGDRAEYRLKSTNLVGYMTARPTQRTSIGMRVGWLSRPVLLSPAGSFMRGNPDAGVLFAHDPTFALAEQPKYGYREVALVADTRDHRSHATRGGLYRATWSGYADHDGGTCSFTRSEVEAAHFVSVFGSRLVLATRGWLVATSTADGKVVPAYLTPALGGNNTLRGYADFRFHDRNLLVVNVESRIAVLTHIDAALFADAGNVAPRVSQLDFGKTSYGVGVRAHSYQSTFARFDIARSREGWRVVLRTTDPLHLARLSRRTASVPFVP